MAKLTDEEFGAKLVAAYRTYRDLHEAGALDADAEHPRDTVNNWINTIRDCKAQDEGGLGPVEIQNKRKVAGGDNPPGGSGQPRPPVAGQDAAAEAAGDDRIRLSGSADIGGALALASARRSSPARIRAMAAAIPGYDRLGRR